MVMGVRSGPVLLFRAVGSCRIDSASDRIGVARPLVRRRAAERARSTDESNAPPTLESLPCVIADGLPLVAAQPLVEPTIFEVLLDLVERLAGVPRVASGGISESIRRLSILVASVGEAVRVLKVRAEESIVLVGVAGQRGIVLAGITRAGAELVVEAGFAVHVVLQ